MRFALFSIWFARSFRLQTTSWQTLFPCKLLLSLLFIALFHPWIFIFLASGRDGRVKYSNEKFNRLLIEQFDEMAKNAEMKMECTLQMKKIGENEKKMKRYEK